MECWELLEPRGQPLRQGCFLKNVEFQRHRVKYPNKKSRKKLVHFIDGRLWLPNRAPCGFAPISRLDVPAGRFAAPACGLLFRSQPTRHHGQPPRRSEYWIWKNNVSESTETGVICPSTEAVVVLCPPGPTQCVVHGPLLDPPGPHHIPSLNLPRTVHKVSTKLYKTSVHHTPDKPRHPKT